MNRTFKVQLYFILIIAVLWGCRTTYEEVMHYESYYDENHLKKKVEGTFYNGRETGEWFFYSIEGVELKSGVYSNGLQDGTWSYHFPFFDGTFIKSTKKHLFPVQKMGTAKFVPFQSFYTSLGSFQWLPCRSPANAQSQGGKRGAGAYNLSGTPSQTISTSDYRMV